MAKQEVAGRRLAVEEREPVTARPGSVEELAIVLESKAQLMCDPL